MDTFRPGSYHYDYSECAEVLCLREWSLGVVNVANTGYYGCVLLIHKYDRRKEKFLVREDLHLVLYDRVVRGLLEGIRLGDMRREIGGVEARSTVSLCYYKKNAKASHLNKNLLSNFVTLDKTGRIIKTNPK